MLCLEPPRRALALRAAEAGAGVEGALKPPAGVRAAPRVWPQHRVKRIIWSVFDLGLCSQPRLYLFVCNLIFSKLRRWQQERKEGMEEGAAP